MIIREGGGGGLLGKRERGVRGNEIAYVHARERAEYSDALLS